MPSRVQQILESNPSQHFPRHHWAAYWCSVASVVGNTPHMCIVLHSTSFRQTVLTGAGQGHGFTVYGWQRLVGFSDPTSSTRKLWKQHLDYWPGALPAVTQGIRMWCGSVTGRRAEEINSETQSLLLQLISCWEFAEELFIGHLDFGPIGSLHSGQGLLAVLPEAEARATSVRPEGLAPPSRLSTVPFQLVAKLFVILLTRAIFPSLFTSDSLKWQFEYLAE